MYSYRTANIDVATATTDSVLQAAGSGVNADKRIGIFGFCLVLGAAAGTVVFKTKPSGASTAISPLFQSPAAGITLMCFPDTGFPIWVTGIGEGLTLTTGATTSNVTGFVLWSFI